MEIKSSYVRPFDLYFEYAIKYIRALLTGVRVVVIYNGSSLKIWLTIQALKVPFRMQRCEVLEVKERFVFFVRLFRIRNPLTIRQHSNYIFKSLIFVRNLREITCSEYALCICAKFHHEKIRSTEIVIFFLLSLSLSLSPSRTCGCCSIRRENVIS